MQDKFDELSDPDPPEGWVREYSPDLKEAPEETPATLDIILTKGSKTIEIWKEENGVWNCGAYELLAPKKNVAIIECGDRELAVKYAQILMEQENTL